MGIQKMGWIRRVRRTGYEGFWLALPKRPWIWQSLSRTDETFLRQNGRWWRICQKIRWFGQRLRCTMASLEDEQWRDDRSDQERDWRNQDQSWFKASDRYRVESGRRADECSASLPFIVPILRKQRKTQLSALPTKRGCFFGRAVQYCKLLAVDASDCARMRPWSRRIRAYFGWCSYLFESYRTG